MPITIIATVSTSYVITENCVKGSPPSGPLFLKKRSNQPGYQISSTFRPTESDSEKNWEPPLILGEKIAFEIAWK